MKNYPENVVLESVNCPNGCKSNDKLVMVGKDRLHSIPGEFTIFRCMQCGLERTTPRPTPQTIGVYYPSNYAPYVSSVEWSTKSNSKIKKWLRKLLGLNARILPNILPGRMLEIGCSSGAYMEQARRSGWHVDGIEFSEEAAAIARSKGFNVQVGNVENARPPETPYDVITAWMVLEHLHEPLMVMKKLKGWVKPDGYLVALVPDTNSLAKLLFRERCYDLQLPTHLFHFSPESLKVLFSNSGWRVERIFWQRNCNTLLWSFEYWARETKKKHILKFAEWLRSNPSSTYIRTMLGVILGITRQSGRIEVWARPIGSYGKR